MSTASEAGQPDDIATGSSSPAIGFLLVSVFSLVVCAALAWAPQLLGDPDTYWHIAAGDWILRHGRIPHVDPFSYTFAGQPWTAHEWLSEVFMALAYRAGGWGGVMALAAAAFGATLAIAGHALRKWLAAPALMGVLVFTALGAAPSLLARPHLLAAPVFVAWLVGLLAAREANKSPSLWLLPLMVLWANLHGSFILGLCMIAVFALEALMQNAGQWLRQLRGWALFGFGAIGAALLTPHGVAGLIFPIKVMGMSTLPIIAEWRSADFSHVSIFEIVLLEGLFLTHWLGVRVPVVRLLLVLGFLHLALAHQRHQLLFVFSAALILAEPVAAALASRAGRPIVKPPLRPQPRAWAPLLAVALVAAASLRIALPVERKDNISPREALAAVDPALRKLPVFNEYDFGGFLIFNAVKPYIDGRADLYGDRFVARYSEVVGSRGVEGLQELDKRGVAWTILRPTSPMVVALDNSREWRRLSADPTAVVHVRIAPGFPHAPPAGSPTAGASKIGVDSLGAGQTPQA